jgi:hypothetical protein
MGLGVTDDAIWSAVETAPSEISSSFPCEHFSSLSPSPDPRDAYVPSKLTDQSKRLKRSYPQVCVPESATQPARITSNFTYTRAAAAIILKIVYGYIVVDGDDSYVALANAAMRTLGHAGIFGTFMVDYIPSLKYIPSWFPGASFKRQAREWHHLSRQMLESLFDIVQRNMVSEDSIYSYIC